MGDQVDRRRMTAIARSLVDVERDDPLRPEELARAVATANQFRVEHGAAPLQEETDYPEEGFYRRARALGLCRNRG